MTEQDAIKVLKSLTLCGICTTGPCGDCERKQAKDIALAVLEQIQQYREIGTVEEIQRKMEELGRWHSDRLNSRIKNEFAAMSTLVCHNCDHKDEYIEELEAEIEEYRTIGTVEEFREAMEKQRARRPQKVKESKIRYTDGYICPSCCGGFTGTGIAAYCYHCGQALDWK